MVRSPPSFCPSLISSSTIDGDQANSTAWFVGDSDYQDEEKLTYSMLWILGCRSQNSYPDTSVESMIMLTSFLSLTLESSWLTIFVFDKRSTLSGHTIAIVNYYYYLFWQMVVVNLNSHIFLKQLRW